MYGIEIKQQAKVKYLGCSLGLRLSGESIALNVIDNVNLRLKLYCTDTTSFWLYLHNLVSRSFKETKIKTPSNAK